MCSYMQFITYTNFVLHCVPHKSQVSIRLLRIPEPASILQIVPANCTGLVEMYLMTMGRNKLFLPVAAYNFQNQDHSGKGWDHLFKANGISYVCNLI